VVVDGELHVMNEVAGAGGHTIALAGSFTCGWRHSMMAKPWCSLTTPAAVVGAVGDSQRGSAQRKLSEERRGEKEREREELTRREKGALLLRLDSTG
jgi:hypothetical protein